MKRIICGLLAIFMGGMMVSAPAMAICSKPDLEKGCVSTSILSNGCSCDSNGSEIKRILGLVLDILSIGVGILGVLGITIVGIQYLTAGGSEEKTRKAKQRLLEIVIGIVAYVVIYWVLTWLLPGFSF